jgi:hypothetical protein
MTPKHPMLRILVGTESYRSNRVRSSLENEYNIYMSETEASGNIF